MKSRRADLLTPQSGRELKSWAVTAPRRVRLLKITAVNFILMFGIDVAIWCVRERNLVVSVVSDTGCEMTSVDA